MLDCDRDGDATVFVPLIVRLLWLFNLPLPLSWRTPPVINYPGRHGADVYYAPVAIPLLSPWHLPGKKPVFVQALLPESTIKRFYGCVVRRLARATEVQFYPIQIGPLIKDLADKLRAVIHPYGFRQIPRFSNTLQHLNHSVAAQAKIHLYRQALTGKVID